MLLPQGIEKHRNLSTSFTRFDQLLQQQAESRFSGYIKLTFWEYEGVLVMDMGRMEGRMTLLEFHQQIKRSGWENALKMASGYDSREFEIYWYTQLRDNYRWYLLLNFDNFLWIAIIGIFFLVFWLKRSRMKQLFRSWREEEINNNLS